MNPFKSLPVVLFLGLVPISPTTADEPEDLSTRLMRATVKIDHNSSTATGLVVSTDDGRHLLVTATHVFETTKGDSTTLIFRQKQSEGEYRKVPMPLVLRRDGKPTWTQHPSNDVSVIEIQPPEGVDLAAIPVCLFATDDDLRSLHVHPGDEVSLLGYPHRNEATGAGFPVLRDGKIASYPLIPTDKTRNFLISANTFEGDSGGPVYLARGACDCACECHEGSGLILGLVSGQRFLDEHMHMIYGTTKVRHRLGLGIIVHASFIRQTIEAAQP